MPDRLAQGVRPGQLAEQIAGYEQDIDLLRPAIPGHTHDRFLQILGAVDAAEAVGQVPVGGMQNSHEFRPQHNLMYCRTKG